MINIICVLNLQELITCKSFPLIIVTRELHLDSLNTSNQYKQVILHLVKSKMRNRHIIRHKLHARIFSHQKFF